MVCDKRKTGRKRLHRVINMLTVTEKTKANHMCGTVRETPLLYGRGASAFDVIYLQCKY